MVRYEFSSNPKTTGGIRKWQLTILRVIRLVCAIPAFHLKMDINWINI
jgi:hypothetical protein